MELTTEMTNAFNIIENSSENLFITGKAGTGKTTFLKYIVKHSHKHLIVAASTGIAAINAGGMTLHRLFSIPLEILDPNAPIKSQLYKDKFKLFQMLDTIIIDEASMVRPDVLDHIDKKLRLYRLNAAPFGGVQIILFGDLFQLPPVVKKNEADILQQWYKGFYFFHSKALREIGFKIIELTKVFRQHDDKFINILNRIREYQLLSIDIEDLCELRDNRRSRDYTTQAVHICSLKKEVEKINTQMLGEPTHTFSAVFKDDFNRNNAPCDTELKLRIGARVMTLINDANQGFYNGSMGTVTEINDTEIGIVLDNGTQIKVVPYTWVEKEYKVKGSKITTIEKGSCSQFPIALGWAITIHKSQGLTFDNIAIHCPYAFAPGMLYVALSRCTSMQGIVTDFFIGPKSIIIDKELLAFNKACKANHNVFNIDVYRALCRYMGYEID